MTTVWDNATKPTTTSGGWNFNELTFMFNEAIDEETGSIVYFNGVGTGQTWLNDTAHSSTFSNETKNTSTYINITKN